MDGGLLNISLWKLAHYMRNYDYSAERLYLRVANQRRKPLLL